MPSQGGRVHFVREPRALACAGLGESLWLPGSRADRKVKSLSCVANESGSQRPRKVRRWLEPSLLNEALAERRGLDRFDIGIGPEDIGINVLRPLYLDNNSWHRQ